VKEYLRERLGDPITLDDLADYADLDKFHLCRAFRAQVGMPPHRYLTHLRIARAKELLLRGVRASDVAPLVGLYDQAQLTRHFRRLVGTTPARYGRSPRDASGVSRDRVDILGLFPGSGRKPVGSQPESSPRSAAFVDGRLRRRASAAVRSWAGHERQGADVGQGADVPRQGDRLVT
jgi:AraC-like DNA-binding protein